jgi:ribosomal protein S18 acetylase RimI-like enzyme
LGVHNLLASKRKKKKKKKKSDTAMRPAEPLKDGDEAAALALGARLLSGKDHRRIAGAIAYYRHEPHAFDSAVFWWRDAEDLAASTEVAFLVRTRQTWCVKASSRAAAAAVLALVPWADRKTLYFSCVDTDFERDELAGLGPECWPAEVCRTDTRHFALPAAAVERIRGAAAPPAAPDGYAFSSLDAARDADMVAAAWPYNYEAPGVPPQYVIRRIKDAPSASLVHAETGQVAAFALVHAYGSIGILHVFPAHRRRGLARAILDRMAHLLVAAGRPVFANTVVGNDAGMALMEAAGFVDEGGDSWLFWDERERHPPACG